MGARTMGNWGNEQEKKTAERTAAPSESTALRGTHCFPHLSSPEGSVWAEEEEEEEKEEEEEEEECEEEA
jgi:hypothetical protein